jgi:hypothetical protein
LLAKRQDPSILFFFSLLTVSVRWSNLTRSLSPVLTMDGGGKVTRQGCLASLVRSFPVRTRKELTQFIVVVVFLDGTCPSNLQAWPQYALGDQEK